MLYMFMLSTANHTTLASRKEDIPGNSSLKSQNPLLVCINFSLIQDSTLSFLGLELMRNFRECLLIQNDIVPLFPLYSTH